MCLDTTALKGAQQFNFCQFHCFWTQSQGGKSKWIHADPDRIRDTAKNLFNFVKFRLLYLFSGFPRYMYRKLYIVQTMLFFYLRGRILELPQIDHFVCSLIALFKNLNKYNKCSVCCMLFQISINKIKLFYKNVFFF